MSTCRSDLMFIVYSQWLLHTYFNTEIKASSEESVTIIFIPMIVLQVNSVTLKLRTFAIRDFTVHVSKSAKIVSLYLHFNFRRIKCYSNFQCRHSLYSFGTPSSMLAEWSKDKTNQTDKQVFKYLCDSCIFDRKYVF